MSSRKLLTTVFLRTFFTSLLSACSLIFFVSVLVNEAKLAESIQLNQWLARDIASQFTGASARLLSMAQKFGSLVMAESGSMDARAQSEFDKIKKGFNLEEVGLKAVWVADIGGAGPIQPLAKFDSENLSLDDSSNDRVRELMELSLKDGTSAGVVSPKLNAIAVKTGDRPRAVILFFDDSFFSRLSGGPRGDKWYLLAPSSDKTGSVLAEASQDLSASTQFPSLDEVAKFVVAETPDQQRSEFSNEVLGSSGERFQMSGVVTGAFGVTAVAVTPLQGDTMDFLILLKIALGVALVFALIVTLGALVFRRDLKLKQ